MKLFAFFYVFASLLSAQNPPEMRPPILEAHFNSLPPQKGDTLFVDVDIDPRWHITANQTADEFAFPCKLESLAPGFEFEPAIYPPAVDRYVPELNLTASEFLGTIRIALPLKEVQATADPGQIKLQFHFQACSNQICLAPDKVEYQMPATSTTPQTSEIQKKNDRAEGFWILLLGALFGGLLLNLMPCVLPVLSLKVYQLLDKGQKEKGSFLHGGVFSLGILVSLWILALGIVILRKSGEQVGWGFQLQNPFFVILLSIFLCIFTLNLFGVIEFTLPQSANRNATRLSNAQGLLGSFFSGVFLTLIATPCSAPFMGSAIGYSLSLPTFDVLMVFTALGVGLAFPYLILSAFPQFMRYLPAPGPWMNHFKHFTGFILFGTLLFMLWILQGLEPSMVFSTLAYLWVLSLGIWFLGAFAGFDKSAGTRWGLRLLVLVALSVLFKFYLFDTLQKIDQQTPTELSQQLPAPWETFTEEKLQSALKKHERIFIDFTARWCLTCQVNKKTVLHNASVLAEFQSEGVRLFHADWTKKNDEITKRLNYFQRNSVPVYVYYNEKGEFKILPELLQKKDILSLF